MGGAALLASRGRLVDAQQPLVRLHIANDIRLYITLFSAKANVLIHYALLSIVY